MTRLRLAALIAALTLARRLAAPIRYHQRMTANITEALDDARDQQG